MRGPVAVLVAVLVLAAAPAARAEVVTLGASLTADSTEPRTCAGGCTVSPTLLPDGQLTAPFRGVITSWRFKAGANVTPARLVVVRRPQGPGDAPGEIVARSPEVPPTANGIVIDVRIPISAGEYIGLQCCDGAVGDFFVPAGRSDQWEPALTEAGERPDVFDAAITPNISATLETDVDGDGLGDESKDTDDDGDGVQDTADGCPTVAAPGGCPAVQPAPRVNAPPTVRFRTPLAATTVATAQAIDLEVSDDAGAPKVAVYDDDGTICALAAPPYSCIWTPTGADVGRATLLASAVDAEGRTTLGIVRVTVPRFAATLTKRRSGRRVSGALRLPAAVQPALGCRGTVTVRRGKAKRATALKRNCTYSVRLPKANGAVKARFGGNPVVLPT